MHIRSLVPAALALMLAGAAMAGVPAPYTLTFNPADVPGAIVDFGALPPGVTAFFEGTRIGQSVESALEYEFMGERIGMGYRAPGADEITNTYFPGVATTLLFKFDQPVPAAGAFIRGAHTAGINPAFEINFAAYDEQGTLYSTSVKLPEAGQGDGNAPIFIGIVAAPGSPGITAIDFAPNGIGGIACADLRPGGPAIGAPSCPGDTNGDGVVDFLDLNAVLSDFGLTAPGLAGDVDDDGDCDFVDLNIVLGAFGTTC